MGQIWYTILIFTEKTYRVLKGAKSIINTERKIIRFLEDNKCHCFRI